MRLYRLRLVCGTALLLAVPLTAAASVAEQQRVCAAVVQEVEPTQQIALAMIRASNPEAKREYKALFQRSIDHLIARGERCLELSTQLGMQADDLATGLRWLKQLKRQYR